MMLIPIHCNSSSGASMQGSARSIRCAVPTMGRVVSDSGERGRERWMCDSVGVNLDSRRGGMWSACMRRAY
jgi:hypothetical protein